MQLDECAKDIMTLGMRIVLLWSFLALFTFGKSGWKAHKSWMKAVAAGESTEPDVPATPKRHSAGEDPLLSPSKPPRTEWAKMTEAEIVALTKVVDNNTYGVSSDDVDEEMKRRATYMPGDGLLNGAVTEFGEVFPKLKKAQDVFEGRVNEVADKITRKKGKGGAEARV